jgi:hypothetical protein
MPTLSRPKQAAEVLRRISDVGCSSPGIVFVNGETHAKEYLVECAGNMPDGWKIIVHHENIGCIGALNWCLKEYPNEEWYGAIFDDEFLDPESPSDWDVKLIEAAGKWRIAHAFENWNMGRRCQGYPILGGELVRSIGYLALPTTFHHFGFDSMHDWMNGATPFGGGGLHHMKCLSEIKVHHNRADPDVVLDDCYKLIDAPNVMEKDRGAFWDWIKNDMHIVVKRIREKMDVDELSRLCHK